MRPAARCENRHAHARQHDPPPGLNIDRDRLFDRFYRGDPSRNRRIDGSGLGLSLAREISRAHGGDLIVDPAEKRAGWLAFRLTLSSMG